MIQCPHDPVTSIRGVSSLHCRARTIREIAIVAALASGFYQPTTNAQASAIDAGIAAGAAIKQLQSSISEIVDQLDDRVSARSFQLRTELVFLQSELGHTADKLVGKTFGELTDRQQQFLEDATNTITQAKVAAQDAAIGLQDLVKQVEHVAAMIPLADKEPRVRKSSPAFVRAPLATDPDVTLSINGSFLKHGKVALNMNGLPCKLTSHIDVSASFACPAKALVLKDERITHVTGAFDVEGEASWWQRVKNVFGAKMPTKTYTLPLVVVPRTLGKYAVTLTQNVDEIESADRKGDWGQTNPHCVGQRRTTANFGPAGPGWVIDTSTIVTSQECGRGSPGHALRNVSQAGFQVESWASNTGNCVSAPWPASGYISYDARGCSAGVVRWTERKSVQVRRQVAIEPGILEWGKSVSIPITSNTVGFLVSVVQLDGTKVDLVTATPSKWFAVKKDGAGTHLIVEPFELEQALR